MGLKKFYYSLENKWYDFVEKTGLYKVTDKIDKFMPSFIFVILLVIMIIAAIFLLLPTMTGTGGVSISFKVMDEDDNPVPLAPVLVTLLDNSGKTHSLKTNEDGLTRSIKLKANTEYSVDIDYSGSGYENFSYNYIAEYDEEKPIYLSEIQEDTTLTYSFTLVDSQTRAIINKSGSIEFMCSNFGGLPPEAITFTSGNITVVANSNCQLKAKSILVQGYTTRNEVSISQNTGTIDLVSSGPIDLGGVYPIYVTVLGESGETLTGMTAKLFANGIEVFGKSCETTDGACTILGVEPGSYVLKVMDTRAIPEYGVKEEGFSVSGTTSKTFTLTRTIEGYIQVKVKKINNQAIENAEIKLRYGDTIISSGHKTNSNGIVNVPVYDLSKTYRIIVSKEGYIIGSASNITASEDIPNSPTVTITLQQITAQTTALIKVRVLNSETGKGFSHAQVVLYDHDTGFLTDYDSQLTNSDGNCTFRVTSGNYYAKAFKGASEGTSDPFEVVISASTEDIEVIMPIEVVKGTLNITVVDSYGDPVPRANILLFDKYNSRRTVWGGDLTNVDGAYQISELTSDSEVYAVVTDIADDLGSTQSEYVYIRPDTVNELKVTLYPKQTSLQKPQIKFLGFFNDAGEKLNGYLRSGAEYKARFLLLVPQDRDGRDEFEEIGAVIRTGSPGSVATPYMENDNIYIKEINLPNSVITKYTQYSSDAGYDGIDDVDTLTEGDAKWAKVVFDEVYGSNYANAYTIMTAIKIKDTAVYGEEVSINYLGYGYTERNVYESDPADETSGNNDIEYQTQKTETFNIGEEQACSDDFCFNLSITNIDEDLREDVVDSYTAAPNQHYKLKFGLINNDMETMYNINSRIQIKNEDKGLKFSTIKITQPNGQVSTQTANDNNYEYNIPITQYNPHTKITGDIDFIPILKGDRIFTLTFISDQKLIFTKQVAIHVLSDKTFTVKVTPEVIPSGKNFNLLVEVKDATTNIEVDKPVSVRVKDRFKRDLAGPVDVGALGMVSINNIPGQESENKVYVYVEAQQYETSITELEVTDEIFKITPTRLGISLNVNTKKTESAKFTIENLSESSLTIDSIMFMGNDSQIDVIDVQRINNSLIGYSGTEIPGIDSSDEPGADNYNNKKEIEATFFTSPRASTITSVRNISSKLVIKLKDKYNNEYFWATELPVTLTVGFEGLMDDSHCMTLSEEAWETTVVDKYVEKQFTFKNNCGVSSRPVPLNGGLAAKVEYEGSNPVGVFSVNVGNRLVELSHGYFKNIYDSVDSEKLYNVNLKYTPVGRFTGDIKGKIIFRSLNDTGSGAQELISEYKFVLHVISLGDCYTVSKKVLTAKDTGEPDSFVIENKGCGSEITYRLSCDECTGLVLSPKENIVVPATGTSEEIKVMSQGAMPGIYLLNIYSKVNNARGSERNVGKVRVEVRPVSQCIDLDRYEYDLYRYEYSENTGNPTAAKSYDTGNIINRCYGQEVKVLGQMKKDAIWKMALFNGLRDGLFSWGVSSLFKNAEEIGDFLGGAIDKLKNINKKDYSKSKNPEAEKKKDLIEALDNTSKQLNKLEKKDITSKNKQSIKDQVDGLETVLNEAKGNSNFTTALAESDIQKKVISIESKIENIRKKISDFKGADTPASSTAPPGAPEIEIKDSKATIKRASQDNTSELFYVIKSNKDPVTSYADFKDKYSSEINITGKDGNTIYAIACNPGTATKDDKNCSGLNAAKYEIKTEDVLSDAYKSANAAAMKLSEPTIEIKDGNIFMSPPENYSDLEVVYQIYDEDCDCQFSIRENNPTYYKYTDPIKITPEYIGKSFIALGAIVIGDSTIETKTNFTCKCIKQEDLTNNESSNTVSTPVATPGDGTYDSLQMIELTTKTSDANIYYTTDGTTPTCNGKQYKGISDLISIYENTTLKAIACKNGMTQSDILEAKYTINLPPLQQELSVADKRLAAATNATAGSACNKDGTVSDSEEYLFNIRPNGDPYVYVCISKTQYKGCISGEWSAATNVSSSKSGHLLRTECPKLS